MLLSTIQIKSRDKYCNCNPSFMCIVYTPHPYVKDGFTAQSVNGFAISSFVGVMGELNETDPK